MKFSQKNICCVANDEDLDISRCLGEKVVRSFALCHHARNTLVLGTYLADIGTLSALTESQTNPRGSYSIPVGNYIQVIKGVGST